MNPYESPTHCEKVRPDWLVMIWGASLMVAIIGMIIAVPIANAMVWVESLKPYSFAVLKLGLALFVAGYFTFAFATSWQNLNSETK